ncbi:uncharacterized protein GGS22DRAFT_2192 [Annulohypoxylon maeteangense]|uniref:uncharacterized protein n=1 Tax=Annulohypoxylon maeteangense TaxID=1927788 RepID=UPI0020077C8E|nr:uncharacterized protein GGS22DRAFT_2192 [Annulohypoxylon maeteangense]KAI0889640.1 hypothetical protein GGS22DRAFT_2192 [Annulohypoxylon maeteangense]
MDEEVDQFMSITGVAAERVARGYLEISGGDPMQAIQLYFENPELEASFNAPAASTSASTSARQPPTAATGSQNFTGREDSRGFIVIDSDDDDDDVQMDDNDFAVPDDGDDNVAAIARNAQEEEDAAMARRLQEEMYSENHASGDGVRAPIAQTTETLAAPNPSWGMDDDRDAAVMEQLRRQRRADGSSTNPFNQSSVDWSDTDDRTVPGARSSRFPPTMGAPDSTTRRLRDLFSPPTSLINRLPLESARDLGKNEKKWILVNLQKLDDFRCQVLNRDHWKNENIVSLVREHFIFLQYTLDDPLSRSYTQFYFHNGSHEDENNYPHVSIIDPRTGEQVKVWSGESFPSPEEFNQDLVEFLDRYSLAANSKNPVVKTKPKSKPKDIGRMTEEEMLEMALKNSLDEDGGPSEPSVLDPDALTKSNPDIGKGKGKELADPDSDAAEEASGAAFAQISSSNPHVEPDNNPATTTRIQFRHAGGRIIRRFLITDTIRRIYEWLKAEPLEGKEGVTFELKAIPGGDLIGELEKSIQEAGLKQGTVMIEFIEDS